MTDNIVTRLREKYSGQLPICFEAANEIERLCEELSVTKTQLAYWREIALENQTNG